jgi:hypothetical protein
MPSLVLYGGLLHPLRANNLVLLQAASWLNGILRIEHKPYFRLLPTTDNYIELKQSQNRYVLTVNDRIIYTNSQPFGYTVTVNTRTKLTDFYTYY